MPLLFCVSSQLFSMNYLRRVLVIPLALRAILFSFIFPSVFCRLAVQNELFSLSREIVEAFFYHSNTFLPFVTRVQKFEFCFSSFIFFLCRLIRWALDLSFLSLVIQSFSHGSLCFWCRRLGSILVVAIFFILSKTYHLLERRLWYFSSESRKWSS